MSTAVEKKFRADAVRSEAAAPRCVGPECAARADKVRDGFGFGFRAEEKQQQQQQQQQQKRRGKPPFSMPKPEYKTHREGTVPM